MEPIAAFVSVPGVQLVIGGGMGGIARWLFLQTSWRQGLIAIILGAILGYYVSPQFEPLMAGALAGFAADPEKLPAFAAFATGVGGIGIIGFIIDWVNYRRKQLSSGPSVETKTPKGDTP